MYLDSKKIVFIHIPKTAGNFLSKTLLDYSSDKMRVKKQHDGQDRFEITGRYTNFKHQRLADYHELMPKELFEEAKLLTCVRHPVDRLISMYYSPHRNLKEPVHSKVLRKLKELIGYDAHNSFDLNLNYKKPKRPDLELESFKALVNATATQKDFFKLEENIKPDYIIQHSNFIDSTKNIFSALGISLPDFSNRINSSPISKDLKKEMRRNPEIIDIVKRSKHWDDIAFFNIPEKSK